MRLNKFIFPVLAGSLILTGCYDEKMDWHTPEGHNPVSSNEIPLQLQEEIDNYDYIKNYAAEYMPGTSFGIGLSADKYLNEEEAAYTAICDDYFTQFVTGNAMKMDAMVGSNGALNTTTLDAFLAKAPADKEIFGHNFIWHTQQQQAYLQSLIAPEMIVETDGDIMTMLQNGDFESGSISPWTGWGGESTREYSASEGVDGSGAMQLYNPSAGSTYSAQAIYQLTEPLVNGETYVVRFQARADTPAGSIQFAVQNLSHGNGEAYHTFAIGTDWTTCEYEYTCTKDDAQEICLNFGEVAATYYVDNIEFGTRIETGASAQANRATRATTITYKLKTPEEKRQALLGAMESWIGGMLQHVSGDQRFVGWDVINEPITDGTPQFRGIDNNFGGTWEDDNGNTQYDSAPVENEETGLTLNWGSGHFYWGYYLGMEYATKAFELARQYAPAGMKLYVNDYNLETNPSKLAKLIEFVEYIDNNSTTTVDGIATQMHVDGTSITKEEVDQMFQTMAATGKLVRVSELDVKVNTASPSAEQLQTQSDVYQMIIESYKENVPEVQRGGFIIWGVSDAADEHVYWIPDDAPNLFDADYQRKVAYKGLCDGIAGKDIGAEFDGDMWKDIVDNNGDGSTTGDGTQATE